MFTDHLFFRSQFVLALVLIRDDDILASPIGSKDEKFSQDHLHSEAAPPPRPPAAGGSLRRVDARTAGGDTLFSKSENPMSLAGSGEKAYMYTKTCVVCAAGISSS